MQIYKEFTFRYTIDQQQKNFVLKKKGFSKNCRISVTIKFGQNTRYFSTANVNPITYSICVVLAQYAVNIQLLVVYYKFI